MPNIIAEVIRTLDLRGDGAVTSASRSLSASIRRFAEEASIRAQTIDATRRDEGAFGSAQRTERAHTALR